MNVKNTEAALIGLVLGVVWLIIGYSYENTGIMMLGGIILGLGFYYKFKKEPKQKITSKFSSNKTELF